MISQTLPLGDIEALLVHHWSPWGLVGVLALAAIGVFYRLRAERQRRITLDHVLERAPGGTVITQDKSPAGPAMTIWVGDGPRPTPRPVQVVVQTVTVTRQVGTDER